jgi:tetratricopeptide (TPR) repeat protein
MGTRGRRAPARETPALTPGRKLAFGAAVVAGVFAAAEAALWAAGVPTILAERDPFAGFSESVRVFEPVPGRGVLATPPRATLRSFNYQEFREAKPAGGLRVFTLGGSSAFGFPYGAEVAFTGILGEALKAALPDRTVEAVNASGMSYGSHRLRLLAGELAGYRPDVFVVFEGHNEFVETRFYRDLLARPAGLDPLRKILYRWRLYALLTRALARPEPAAGPGAPPGGPAGRRAGTETGALLGIDVAREGAAAVTAEEKAEALRRFEENLDAIAAAAARAGARLVLCTVPSNLRDWRPNRSVFDPAAPPETRDRALDLLGRAGGALRGGDAAAAAGLLEEAHALAPGHAEIAFALGRAYEGLGRWDEAREAYRSARDADAQPVRAPGPFNDAIRRAAGRTGAVLVDAEREFEAASPHGLTGFDLVEDYVHPTPEGHGIIALALYRAFFEKGILGPPRGADEAIFARVIEARVARLGGAGAPAGGAPGSAPAAGEAGPAGPSGPRAAAMLFNMGVVLENQGELQKAADAYAACLERDPTHYAARCNLGWILHDAGALDQALSEFRRALETEPGHLNCLLGLGQTLSALSQAADSEAAFRRAVEADARSALAWSGLGVALAQQERVREAEAAFRRGVELDPASADAQAYLGQALMFQGRLDEAAASFRRSLALEHRHQRARIGLAGTLLRQGNREEAARIYRDVLAEDPDDPWARRGIAEIEGGGGAAP